jgi:sugar-specific transcriptional regulator TrmB
MNQEQIITALRRFGLSTTDTKIYLYLTIKGRQSAKTLSEGLFLQKSQVYRSLRHLRDKQIIIISRKPELFFYACPFGEVLKDEVEEKIRNVENLRENKLKILASWKKIIE